MGEPAQELKAMMMMESGNEALNEVHDDKSSTV